MSFIHWYPGHIAKAERKLKEQICLCDVVIEVLDARIPISSMYPDVEKLIVDKPRLILLNKYDLADGEKVKQFVKVVEEKTGSPVILSNAHQAKDINQVVSKVLELSKPKILALMQKGLLARPARVMVIGMPNVGKSSIINKLIKKSKTKTGAKAGVTRQQQWVRVHPKIDLLDTPGIIPLKQDDQNKAQKLAFVNSVSENAYSHEAVAIELLALLNKLYKKQVYEYYKLDDETELTLENIAKSRNWILTEKRPDINRCATFVLLDFRDGRIGKFVLDEIE